jgi:hypothetical protein
MSFTAHEVRKKLKNWKIKNEMYTAKGRLRVFLCYKQMTLETRGGVPPKPCMLI